MSVLAALCGLLGLVSAAAVLLRARDVGLAVRVLLPFLLDAVLLRLSADPTWRDLLVAAVVVGLQGVGAALTTGSPTSGATTSGPTTVPRCGAVGNEGPAA